MYIPTKCQVLVFGGGPAGSYCAAALACEGIDTVVLEAEKFPRYHIGESMVPSIRPFLRFIDAEDTFLAHGFHVKNGAAFTITHNKPAAYTDFIKIKGPENHAWNVVRSEADELLFRHASKSGARTFDGVRVDSISFKPWEEDRTEDERLPDPGRPVSAKWSCKSDGTSGEIGYDYLVDASGRAVSTKYLRNRQHNDSSQLNGVDTWAYWEGAGTYGTGTTREGAPYFEALHDGSGWAWFIHLHTGQTSIGIVRNQDRIKAARKEQEPRLESVGRYLDLVRNTPGIQSMLEGTEMVSQCRSASDWSYSATAYASPYVRLVGDAASFIDPFFSSGVHIAHTGGLSAATTICASIRGDCSEADAGVWHSEKISETYTRFLVVVTSALAQIRAKKDLVIAGKDEETFDRAFEHFRPIIQGDTDVTGGLSQQEVAKTVDFCFHSLAGEHESSKQQDSETSVERMLSPGQIRLLNTIRSRWEDHRETSTDDGLLSRLNSQLQRLGDNNTKVGVDEFGADVINGLTPRLKRGCLGLSGPITKPPPQVVAQRGWAFYWSTGGNRP